jgi:ketosteroid isomerase-like protein
MDPQLERSIRTIYEAFKAGDFDRLLANLRPDAMFVNPADAIEPGTRHGREGFLVALRSLHEQFDYDVVDPYELVEGEGCVLVSVRLGGLGRTSGARFDQESFQIFRIRDGSVTAFEWYLDRAEARRAAGLD